MLQLMGIVRLSLTLEVQIHSIVGHIKTNEAPSCSLSVGWSVLVSWSQ